MALYCICGGSMRATSRPPEVAESIGHTFWLVHAGAGHGPTDSRTAGRARRAAGM